MRLYGSLKAKKKLATAINCMVKTQTSKEKQQPQKWAPQSTAVMRTASESLTLVSSVGKRYWQYEMTRTEA